MKENKIKIYENLKENIWGTKPSIWIEICFEDERARNINYIELGCPRLIHFRYIDWYYVLSEHPWIIFGVSDNEKEALERMYTYAKERAKEFAEKFNINILEDSVKDNDHFFNPFK